jgi:phospholipase C
VSQFPSPIRPASLHRRRPSRAQIARRRAGAVAGLIVVAVLAWSFWPSGGGPRASGDGGSPTPGGGNGNGNGGHGGTVDPDGPIKHVVFLIKENRTFNNYFATYPGAKGSTTGGTLRCTSGTCTAGPDYELTRTPDISPHDISHGFSSGLYAINGGEMNG